MEFEGIRNIVLNRGYEMVCRGYGVTTDPKYRLGVVTGIVEGFEFAGMLTRNEAKEILDEVRDLIC